MENFDQIASCRHCGDQFRAHLRAEVMKPDGLEPRLSDGFPEPSGWELAVKPFVEIGCNHCERSIGAHGFTEAVQRWNRLQLEDAHE